MTSQKYKTIRAVVECRVPPHITEKRLVWCLKEILKWPIQTGVKGDMETLVRTKIKEYGRVTAAERQREAQFWEDRHQRKWGV